MKKRTRNIILLVCVVLFLGISPALVFYSMGYRYDFKNAKVVATGGIYVRTFPAADAISINGGLSDKPGLFANSLYISNLLPDSHTVSIEKAGYHGYVKTITVTEKSVTKLENIHLFQNDIAFTVLPENAVSPFAEEPANRFALRSGAVYYADIPQNAALSATVPLVKNAVAFTESGNALLWLANDGILYQANLSALPLGAAATPVAVSKSKVRITANTPYEIIQTGQDIFVNNGGYLLKLIRETDEWEVLAQGIKEISVAPDGDTIAFASDSHVYVSSLDTETEEPRYLLYKSESPVANLQWLNDYYIVFTSGNYPIITETDWRGQINTVTLPDNTTIDGKTTLFKTPQLIFSRPQGRLYVLTEKQVLVSEELF